MPTAGDRVDRAGDAGPGAGCRAGCVPRARRPARGRLGARVDRPGRGGGAQGRRLGAGEPRPGAPGRRPGRRIGVDAPALGHPGPVGPLGEHAPVHGPGGRLRAQRVDLAPGGAREADCPAARAAARGRHRQRAVLPGSAVATGRGSCSRGGAGHHRGGRAGQRRHRAQPELHAADARGAAGCLLLRPRLLRRPRTPPAICSGNTRCRSGPSWTATCLATTSANGCSSADLRRGPGV